MKKTLFLLIIFLSMKCASLDIHNSGLLGSEENLLQTVIGCLFVPCGSAATVPPATDPPVIPLPVGELDTSFGGTGYVTLDVAGFADQGWGVVTDSLDNIILAGNSSDGVSINQFIWKVNADGGHETTFNSAGYSVTNYNYASGSSIAYTADDSFIVAGTVWNTTDDMAVWKYGQDGLFDFTFSVAGLASHDNATGAATAGSDMGNAVAIDSTGRIVVGGYSYNVVNLEDAAVWRYNSDGTLDATFNGVGFTVGDGVGGQTGSNDIITDLIIDNAGKIVFVGTTSDTGGNSVQFMMRMNQDGTIDTGFNLGAPLVFQVNQAGGYFQGLGVNVIQAGDGSYFISSAEVNTANYLSTIKKISPDGTLDTTFQNSGILVLNAVTAVYVLDMEIDAAGNLLLAGIIAEEDIASIDGKVLVMRLLPDGSPDSAFGAGCPGYPSGCVYHNFSLGVAGFDAAASMVTDSQNRIILGGYTFGATTEMDATIWRLR